MKLYLVYFLVAMCSFQYSSLRETELTFRQVFPDVLESLNTIYGNDQTEIIALEVSFSNSSSKDVFIHIMDESYNNPDFIISSKEVKLCNINWGKSDYPSILKKRKKFLIEPQQSLEDTLFFSLCTTSKSQVELTLEFIGSIDFQQNPTDRSMESLKSSQMIRLHQ
jgi:hypothetical protein